MSIEKVLCLGVGFFLGVCFCVLMFVCLSDWMDERERREKHGE